MSDSEIGLSAAKDAFDEGLFSRCIRLATGIATGSESQEMRGIASFLAGLAHDARDEQEAARKAYADGVALYEYVARQPPEEFVDIVARAMTSFGISLLSVQQDIDAERVVRLVTEHGIFRITVHASWAKSCLAQIYMKRGRYSEAAILYGEAIEQLRNSRHSVVELLISRSCCLAAIGEYETAGASLRDALSENPSREEMVEILMGLAEVSNKLEESGTSIEYLEEARHFLAFVGEQNAEAVRVDLATVAYNASQPEIALEILGPVLGTRKTGQEATRAADLAGSCYYVMGDDEAACRVSEGILNEAIGSELELGVRRRLIYSNAYLQRWDMVDSQIDELKASGLADNDPDLSQWIAHRDRGSWLRLLKRTVGEVYKRRR